mmetsp:Transcript_95548/g.242866  ORF Transcript_95548/g.242866 Transcript_95548/m.242866 type:complete len:234 (+) Transcript_95548:159-860(+)
MPNRVATSLENSATVVPPKVGTTSGCTAPSMPKGKTRMFKRSASRAASLVASSASAFLASSTFFLSAASAALRASSASAAASSAALLSASNRALASCSCCRSRLTEPNSAPSFSMKFSSILAPACRAAGPGSNTSFSPMVLSSSRLSPSDARNTSSKSTPKRLHNASLSFLTVALRPNMPVKPPAGTSSACKGHTEVSSYTLQGSSPICGNSSVCREAMAALTCGCNRTTLFT